MKVSIGDLDYYYTEDKINCFNPDVMKISSYHKQLGDAVNFVMKPDDIYRPYDIYYIIKEKSDTPNPPYDFYTNGRVKGWGAACKYRINWEMDPVMLGCRPDYLLYPEKNTKIERAEQIRLLDNNGNLLPITQDGHNSFKNKKVIVTDAGLWTTSPKNTITALKQLAEIKNLYFLEPIWLERLASDEEVMNQFLKLEMSTGANLTGVPVFVEDARKYIDVLRKIKDQWPNVKIGPLKMRFRPAEHWDEKENALKDWRYIQDAILYAKKLRIVVVPMALKHRLDTPYFLLFETVENGMRAQPAMSWLEWITSVYGPGLRFRRNTSFWGHPEKWNEVFRDLLRQTRNDIQFLTLQWGDKKLSENDIPWNIGKEAFKYEI